MSFYKGSYGAGYPAYTSTSIPAPVEIDAIAPAFNEVLGMTAVLSRGKYQFTVSLVAQIDTSNDTVIYRVTGGLTSPEFRLTPTDNDDSVPITYTFPFNWVGGEFDVDLEAALDPLGSSPSALIVSANIIMQKVGNYDAPLEV